LNVAIKTADNEERILNFTEQLGTCDVYHRGVALDLGSAAADGRFGFSTDAPAGVKNLTREGATWARIETRQISQSFYLDHAMPVFISARIRGVGSRSALLKIDNKSAGVLVFSKDDVKVVSSKTTEEPLSAGAHVVSMHFMGTPANQAFAEIDWLRVGEPDDDTSTYAAPTLRDLVADVAIKKQPYKAIAMRAPGTVSCVVGIREGARLRTVAGYSGIGEGEVEIRLSELGRESVSLQVVKVGGEKDLAAPIDLALDEYAGKVVSIQFVARSAGAGGRVLLGDPHLVTPKPQLAPPERTKVVVVVVLSNVDGKMFPPNPEAVPMPSLGELVPSSVAFRRHRASTTVASGSMASLLTGLSPSVHSVMDSGARLPARFPTIGSLARDGRVTTAMFSSNPTTFPAFGFNRSWDRYETISPVSGITGRSSILDFARWLETRVKESKDERILAVVHARGAHPPWTATAEEVRQLPPEEYMGPIDGRRGGQVLQKARGKRPKVKLKPEDYERIRGYVKLALLQEDKDFSQVVEALRKLGLWESTLLVVTSDVAMGGANRIPFTDGDVLGEDLLDLPMLVRFPGGRFGGTTVDVPTTHLDLLPTIAAAFGLSTSIVGGDDLFQIAARPARFSPRLQLAVLGPSYSTRFADFLLTGVSPKAPSLCDLAEAEPCADVIKSKFSGFVEVLFRITYSQQREAMVAKRNQAGREPATIDPDTTAALMVWGNQEVQ
jgi:hypothetical protein